MLKPHDPALLRLARLHLELLRREHPEWRLEDLRRELRLEDSPALRRLAEEAGFRPVDTLTPEEEARVLRVLLKGAANPSAIARATGLDEKLVHGGSGDITPNLDLTTGTLASAIGR